MRTAGVQTLGVAAAVLWVLAAGPGRAESPVQDLDGTWRLVKVSHEGRDVQDFTGWLFRIRQGRLEIRTGWQGQEEHPADPGFLRGARLRLDPAASPRAVDFELSPGVARGMTVPGIYQVQGDRLLIAVRTLLTAAQPRPKGYATVSGSLIALTLERAPAEAGPAEKAPEGVRLTADQARQLRKKVGKLQRLKPPGLDAGQWRQAILEALDAMPERKDGRAP